MKKTVCIVFLASLLSAEDVMVERMQSVVDEVIELRSRYESSARNNKACQEQVREQARMIEEVSRNDGLDYKSFEENRKRLELLEDENSALKKRLASRKEDKTKSKEMIGLEQKVEALSKENVRLNSSATILMEKNHALLDQLNGLKRSSSEDELTGLKKEMLVLEEKLKASQETNKELEQQIMTKSTDVVQEKKPQNSTEKEEYRLLSDENRRLEKELQALKTKTASLQKPCTPKTITKIKQVTKKDEPKRICLDDNPFPKLMMKDEQASTAPAPKKRLIDKEEVPNSLEESMFEDNKEVILENGRTYRLKHESAVYNAPGGEVIAIWEEKTSFTSNIYKGEWIKITGHFINMKWTKSAEEMWVKEKDTVKR